MTGTPPDAATRCTDCEAVALATVQDRHASQLLPIPRLAMAGFADGRDSAELTRRRLMQFGSAGLASVYAPRLLGWHGVPQCDAARTLMEIDPCSLAAM